MPTGAPLIHYHHIPRTLELHSPATIITMLTFVALVHSQLSQNLKCALIVMTVVI